MRNKVSFLQNLIDDGFPLNVRESFHHHPNTIKPTADQQTQIHPQIAALCLLVINKDILTHQLLERCRHEQD